MAALENEVLSERGDGEASGVPRHELRTFRAGTLHSIIPLVTRFEARSAEPSFAFDQPAAASRFEVKEGLRELLRSPPVVPFGTNCPRVTRSKTPARNCSHARCRTLIGSPRQFGVKSAAGPGTLELRA
jgi:hypothetical protein